MADGTSSIVPATPTEAVTPRGINHLVINVRDIEESHKFWTETSASSRSRTQSAVTVRCAFTAAITMAA